MKNSNLIFQPRPLWEFSKIPALSPCTSHAML
jgi:hypothetical protein